MKIITLFVFILIFLSCKQPDSKENITENEFIEIVNGVSKGWNEENAELSAQYFDDDAVYEEPPKQQFYRGKANIFKFFGGIMGRGTPMKMKWHNLAFNEEVQVGFGEYTFARLNQFHGIVVLKFKNGKILKWREYQYKSDLNWTDFTGESEFKTVK